MKIILEYDSATGMLTDKNGLTVFLNNAAGFDEEKQPAPVMELIKQGVTPDEIIKLKNHDLL